MATEKVRIKYEVDKKQLDESNKSLKKTIKGNDLTQKEVDQTTQKFKDQNKELKKTNTALKGTGDQLKGLANRFTIAGKGAGDLATGMFAASKATSGTSKAMKILKVAIASTGIGLLIVAIGSLVAAFKSSEAGQNKFKKLMDVIGVVVGNVSDIFANIGEKIIAAFESPKETILSFANSIKQNIVNRFEGLIELIPQLSKAISQLFELDFAGAAKTAGDAVAKVTLGVEDFTDKTVEGFNAATEAVKDFTNQTKAEVAEAARLADLRAATDKLQREFLVKTAELEGRVADLRLKGKQEDQFTAKERLAFLNEANRLQNELIETELIIAKNRAEEIRISNTFSKSTKDNLDAEAEAQANIFRVETKRLNQQRTLQREINTASRQAQATANAEAKAIQAKVDAQTAASEELDAIIAKAIEKDIVREALKTEAFIKAEAEKAEAQQLFDEQVKDSKINAGKSILSNTKLLAKEGSALSKAAALGEIAVDTGVAISGLTAASESNPANAVTFGGAGILQFAAGLLRIGINIANAKSLLTSAPKLESGGKIGGKRHSQGGTIVEAEIGEHMMNRDATAKYGHDFFDKINKLEYRHDTFDKVNRLELDTSILSGKSGGSSINIIDTTPIARAMDKRPINQISLDQEGFNRKLIKDQYAMKAKLSRYST